MVLVAKPVDSFELGSSQIENYHFDLKTIGLLLEFTFLNCSRCNRQQTEVIGVVVVVAQNILAREY